MFELIIFIIGLFFGSFLGVLVERFPKKESVIKGRSRCDKCKKELGLFDLIPVLSFFFLKGKCRYCHTPLSYFYPIIEILTGILFVLTYIFLIPNFKFIPNETLNILYYFLIISSFIVIFFTDLKYGIIPDKILLPGVIITLGFLLVSGLGFMINHLLSGMGAFLFFVIISYLFYVFTKKQSMGGGDIKLVFFLGLFLGFPNIVICLYLAFLTGGVLSIILILWKKKDFSKGTLPFGPFLIMGAIISMFWGNQIYPLALNLLGI